MKFVFIEQYRNEFPVQQMCELLTVSSSGFYAWSKREPSRREQENRCLTEQIRVLHQRSRQTYYHNGSDNWSKSSRIRDLN